MYGMGISKFTQLSREAKALYKIDRLVLVNCEILRNFLKDSGRIDIRLSNGLIVYKK